VDVTQALKDTENGLRDFIASVLRRKLGVDWVQKCGVPPDRLAQWAGRKEEEAKRQRTGVVDERLLFYSDFYDLETILRKHWSGEFSQAFGDFAEFRALLKQLQKLRDPDAHRRELLPHQKHLALGIAGEIRTSMIRYRSKQDTAEDCFARIESARDSLGNIIVPGEKEPWGILATVRVGDTVDFVVTATDPLGDLVEYQISTPVASGELPTPWHSSNEFTYTFPKSQRHFEVGLAVRSPRPHHASGDADHRVIFTYEVLPPRSTSSG